MLRILKWLFIIMPYATILTTWRDEKSWEWIAAELIYFVISFVLLYRTFGKKYVCPSCKKRFALKKNNVKIVAQEDISVLVETKRRDSQRNIIGTDEQYIPGLKTTYREYYTCKYCGKTCWYTREKREPKL